MQRKLYKTLTLLCPNLDLTLNRLKINGVTFLNQKYEMYKIAVVTFELYICILTRYAPSWISLEYLMTSEITCCFADVSQILNSDKQVCTITEMQLTQRTTRFFP